MRLFIHHSELARDSRFIRQDNALATVLASMPDDVDTVVRIFEQLDPMIEKSVRGTEAEPLYDEYGAGFGIVGRELVLRRARGYAPLPITNRIAVCRHGGATEASRLPSILTVGGHLKNAVALASGGNVFVSQHIGDLDTRSFRRV